MGAVPTGRGFFGNGDLMQDDYQPFTEYRPTWKHFDTNNPPAWVKSKKMLFKTNHGNAIIGVFYPGCGWCWAAGLPTHSPEDKQKIRNGEL
jgi:hypothetical protein